MGTFTDKARQLFLEIEADIKADPNKYLQAGKWIDRFYNEDEFWKKKREHLEILLESCKDHKKGAKCDCGLCEKAEWLHWVIENKAFTSYEEYLEISDMKKEERGGFLKKGVPAIYRLLEARDDLVSQFECNQGIISTQCAKCVYLINWLLTSPEPRNDTDLKITKFQRYGIEDFEGTVYSRAGLAFFTQRDIDEWLKIIEAAQHRLGFEGREKMVPVLAGTGPKNRKVMLSITMSTSKENWEVIKSEYGISKKDFGRKINFVSDSFKRKVIFRDVEHAFVLASQGFSKPALILAGGVIEELLKEYLKHKKIQPKGDRFVDYIKTCEGNSLLKRGVSRLSDAIRDFRNLVHISKEETARYTISKATAKGAVSSIFTIANDLQ